MVHRLTGIHGTSEPLCGRAVVLRAGPTGFTFATATVTFGGSISVADGDASQIMQVTINSTVFTKVMHPGDTPETIAVAFEQGVNNG